MKRRFCLGIAAAALAVTLCAAGFVCGEELPEEAVTEEVTNEEMSYMSSDGWRVRYNALKIEGSEIDEHTAQFVYLGDSAGTSMVTISYIPDRYPQEVLYEVTNPWGQDDKTLRTEGFFPGTDDKWGYWRTLYADVESSGLSLGAIAGEYNGGVLLFEITAHLCGDDRIDVPMNDALSGVIDSVEYENFEPQTEFSYVPGTYTCEFTDELDGQEVTAVYQVVLNEDHTGTLSIQDEVPMMWGSNELMAYDLSFRYEYTVEGDSLMVNFDGMWQTFTREDAASEEESSGETEPEEESSDETAPDEVSVDETAPENELPAEEYSKEVSAEESDVMHSDDSSDFVLLSEAVPDAILEIRYYSTYNFVGDRIDGYEEPLAFLTKEAAAALKEVSDDLVEKGYRLKIYDAYRPQMAVTNFMNWALDSDDTRMKEYFYPELEKDVLFPQGYIAEFSGHSRGSTVDLTLFDMKTEKEVDMGGTFDYFGELSHPDYTDITEEQYENRMLLRETMMAHGFRPLPEEWWHFTLDEEPYPDTYFTFPINSDSLMPEAIG